MFNTRKRDFVEQLISQTTESNDLTFWSIKIAKKNLSAEGYITFLCIQKSLRGTNCVIVICRYHTLVK